MATDDIYKIINIINSKTYIGSTVNFTRRKAEHKYRRKKFIGNSIIRNAVIKYGENSFKFEILEYIAFKKYYNTNDKESLLSKREQYYVDTISPEYNIRKTDISRNTGVTSEKQKKHLLRISKIPKDISKYRNIIVETTSNGDFIKEWAFPKLAEKELGLYSGSISRVLS